MKRLLCWFFGHDWNQCAYEHGYADCKRCGLSCMFDQLDDECGVVLRFRWAWRQFWFWNVCRFRKLKSKFTKDDGMPF